MTTIAYRDGVIAADTRVTSDSIITGSVRKVSKNGRVLMGVAGTAAMARELRAWFDEGCQGPLPPNPHPLDKEWSVWALIATPTDVYIVQESGICRNTAPYHAMGSGRELALGAMAHGATAEEAVRAAIKHDTSSGGEITVLRH